ncbi:MAG: TetR/AcrR family transcriptional regulator [Actinomycetota bacterium]|nr:TetR/AcrR family transcriptional regulator [Actinomycetota bacterium]
MAATGTETEETPRRADAVRNREAVIKAAEEVFAERGIEAGIPEIAARAGVGKGTVYRNFETKNDLVSAVLTARTLRFSEEILEALEEEDSWEAFQQLLHETVAGKMRHGRNILGLYPHGTGELLATERERTQVLLGQLMKRAQKQGKMRKDAKPADVTILFGGVSRILNEQEVEDPKVWKRQTCLVIDAFRVQNG